ncbi:IGS10 protein, partial [Crotophaga sulcirostris]|nr:IGS10 protein [Crotophaga sulcirostris]
EDGRIIVVKTGTLTLRTADAFDAGLYHCIGTNYNDADTLTFRITVVEPYVEHNSVNGAQLSTSVGSTLYLPCTSTAVPDAAISWVLPDCVVLHHSVRNKQIFDNGTLRIQGMTEGDSGYFRCVAANQYGVDLLVFQVIVRKDETTPKEKQVAVGEWEEGRGSGDAMLGSTAAQKHPLATVAALTAKQESAASAPRNWGAQSAHKRNSYGKMTYRRYRDKTGRRFRGHRRQFVSSARRVDPQRWAAFLEKTKRNSTFIEKQGKVATNPPIQVPKFSEVPGGEEETSGDLMSPEEEFMMPVAETATVSTLGSMITAGPKRTGSNTLARKTSVLVAEAVTPLPSPFPQSASSNSRWPQTYLNPTITNSWERSDLGQISAKGIKNSSVSNGASRTSTLSPTGQSFVYSGESNNQHLKSVSMTSVTAGTDTSKSATSQNAVEKLHVFTESVNEISTKTDDQISVVTVSDPSLEFGHLYFHSTQKRVTPKPPLASTIITHQQIQIIQNVTTHTPQAQQQYGRRRKVSGRRRIVTPGRIPSMKEHRYNSERPGSARGSTAVAADAQLNTKSVSNLPMLNNISSSINLFSPEAPLASPSTIDIPLEHPVDTHQNTVFIREDKNKASARQKATTAVMPLMTKSTQDTPQWKSETSASFQITNSDRFQTFGIGQPTTSTHTAHITTEITHTINTNISSTLDLVSPTINPRTLAKKSQREKITWEHLFGNGAQKEVLLQKQPKQQTDMFLSTEVSTMLPKTTAALSVSKVPPLHFPPIPTGGTHSSGFWSLNKPVHYGIGKQEEHLVTAKPRSYSNLVTGATKEKDVTTVKPTVTPIISPQSDTKITKSKIFRVGRKRGQRRKRPPKIPVSQSVTAGHSMAAIPSENTATTPVVTTVKSLTVPTSLMPADPLSESVSTGLVTEMPVLWTHHTPGAPQHVPAAAAPTSVTPVTWRNIQPAALPPNSHIASSPTAPIQIAPLLSTPSSTTSTRPATVCATSGSEPAQQIKATTTAGEKPHLKMEESVIHENHLARPTFPVKTESNTRAPMASTDTSPPSAQHPTPLP